MQFLYCSRCGTKNENSIRSCTTCGTNLISRNIDIQSLKNDILKLKQEYELKISGLLDKIESLEEATEDNNKSTIATSIESPVEPPIEKPVHIPEVHKTYTQEPTHNKSIYTQEAIEVNLQSEEILSPQEITTNTEETTKEEITQEATSDDLLNSPKRKTTKESLQSFVKVLKSIPLLSFLLEELGAPLVNLSDFVKNIYTTYKEKRQLPVFFMTLAGICALLFGFGYLMQLSVNYFGELSALVKIAFGFACSTGITIWGIRLNGKNEKYQDFSSALIGLAISMNYLFVYFLSNSSDIHPLFSSSDTGFILIVLNTVLAIFFSLRYETKIIAILSLIGGAFAPFYLNTNESSPVYFAYLWILCASSIYIARKIKWQTLGVISFLSAASIIELAVYSNGINAFAQWEYIAIFHAFAYLFLWFSLFNGKTIVTSLNKASVLLIAGNLSLFLFNLFYLLSETGHYITLGSIYIINSLVFFPGLWLFKKNLEKHIKLLILVIAGTFVAFAIPAIFDQQMMGFFWSIEALALIFLGFLFSMPKVRKEGYLLLTLAIIKIVLTLDGLWLISGSDILYTSGYFNLLSLGLVLAFTIYLLEKYKSINLSFENKLSKYTKNIGAIWFMTSYTLTALFYTTEWLSFAAIIPVLIIIAVANIYQLKFSIQFGKIMFIASIVYSVFKAANEIPPLWESTIYNLGFANLLGIGLFLLLLQGLLFILYKKEVSHLIYNKTKQLAQISEYISIWFIITLVIFVSFYTLDLLAYFTVLCSFIYLIWGKWQSQKIKKFAYLIYTVSIVYAALWAYYNISSQWNQTLFSAGYINLLGIGIFAGAMIWFQKAFYKQTEDLDLRTLNLVINLWPLWFTALFLVTGYYYVGNYTLNIAIIPLFAFIYWGHKQKLAYTEYIGIAYSALILLGIQLSVQDAQSLRFSHQTMSGKIAMGELLFCLWFLKIFYDRLLTGNQRGKAMDIVREVFYWIVPLLIISPIKRHFPEFTGVAAWLALFVAFMIYEKTKRKSLLIEGKLLFGLAIVVGLLSEKYFLAIPCSILVLSAIFYLKKGYKRAFCLGSEYSIIYIGSIYYLGACFFVLMNNIFDNIFYGALSTSIYFVIIVIFRKKITPIRNNFLVAFYTALSLTIFAMLFAHDDSSILIRSLALLPIILIGVLLYSQNTIYNRQRKSYWLYLIISTHVLFTVGYSFVLFNSSLTILLILHAILLLFNSMKLHYKPLVWHSIALFAIAVLKLVLWDISNFTMLQKVIVFVVIGALLIGASFLYVKLRDKFEHLEEEKIRIKRE